MVGHRVKAAVQEVESTQWIFEVAVNLHRTHPRIAFLSGLERGYYPEDCGYSKFGLAYQPPFNPDYSSRVYYPPVDTVQKPISNFGYSIGGLSTPRFPSTEKDVFSPSPDKYQEILSEPLLPSHRRVVLPSTLDYVRLSPVDPIQVRKRRASFLRRKRQCIVGFGSMMSRPRFGGPPTFNVPGPGIYSISPEGPPRLTVNASFGRAPVLHEKATDVRCVIDHRAERCTDCGKGLAISDYYRTKFPVKVPPPENSKFPVEPGRRIPTRADFVNLCKVCYYRATVGRSKNWPKEELQELFQKTRTCATVHDHQGVPEVIHKANCKTMRRLQMKENILSKYYSDKVEESITLEGYKRSSR